MIIIVIYLLFVLFMDCLYENNIIFWIVGSLNIKERIVIIVILIVQSGDVVVLIETNILLTGC